MRLVLHDWNSVAGKKKKHNMVWFPTAACYKLQIIALLVEISR